MLQVVPDEAADNEPQEGHKVVSQISLLFAAQMVNKCRGIDAHECDECAEVEALRANLVSTAAQAIGEGLQQGSAGKRKRTRLRKGAPWLKTMMVQCAWAAKRKKDSYYKAQFFRLQAKRGPQKAICAVAASLLTAIYHMLKDGTCHQDLGASYFDRRAPHIKVKRLVSQITKLGFEVTLQPVAKAA